MIRVSQEEDIVFVEFPPGCEVDLAVQQVIQRHRKALFEENGRRKQKVIWTGCIHDLNMSGAKYACSAQVAAITEALVMIANSNLNLTRANMMFGLHKPAFPVLVTPSTDIGLAWLRQELWRESADDVLVIQDGAGRIQRRGSAPGTGVPLGRRTQLSGAQPTAQ